MPIAPSRERERSERSTWVVCRNRCRHEPNKLRPRQARLGSTYHHSVFDCHIGGQREQVETDILAKHRIILSVRRLIDKSQEHLPIADLYGRKEACEDAGGNHKAERLMAAQ